MTIKLIVNKIFNSITYLLHEEESDELTIIDCGDAIDIIKYIEHNNLRLKNILITHTHYDHIYGLNEVVSRFPNTNVYTNSAGKLSLYNDKWNMSRYNIFDTPFIYKFQNVITKEEGDFIDFGKEKIHILSTPGHDWSCLSFKLGNYIFTGDSYIPNIKPTLTFPKSDKKEGMIQYKRLLELDKQGYTILAGHKIS